MVRALVSRLALSRLAGMPSLSARVTAYMLLAVEALDEPGLLRFVPQSVLDRLFGRDAPLFTRWRPASWPATRRPGR